jgi:hypothetical protein
MGIRIYSLLASQDKITNKTLGFENGPFGIDRINLGIFSKIISMKWSINQRLYVKFFLTLINFK